MTDPFKTYLKDLQANLARGDASEHTHRPALKALLEALEPGITATNEPKKYTDCGKPDMRIFRGVVPLGSLETKDIGKKLDDEERTKQIKDYLKGLPNFILTDYLEFRWYVNGKRRATEALGRVELDGRIKVKKESMKAVGDLLAQFLDLKPPEVGMAKDLAQRMAGLAHIIRGAAFLTLEQEPETGTLKSWLATFEKTLLPNLTAAEFADMYAQTIAYGLFAAKVEVGTAVPLSRETAAGLLPPTNPLLRKLFHHLAGLDVPEAVSWAVDELVNLLNAALMEEVIKDFGKGSLEKDPVVHFYETFLAAYDPENRKVRGVYYTPEPVVSYIVRAINYLLRERFQRSWGLADMNTLILDPACGTGTFLHSVIALIYDTLCALGQDGGWKGKDGYVSQSLLPRLFGFELLMAPYAVAHLKLGLLLREKGFDFPPGQRLGVYLTNTLDEGFKKAEVLTLAEFITEESNSAVRIKKEDPIEVILGNPPYAGHSANASFRIEPLIDKLTGKTLYKRGKELKKKVKTFIGQLIEDYKWVDGKPLGEKNPKWLQDDYVKFLRWGQWRITETRRGVLAMITNHGYLDNPTFRGMRQQLMQTFNEIYLLNLHGNAKKKEVCPDGSKDENVFDIQQGVAIGLFVKFPGAPDPARVYYADLWGTREGKNKNLAEMEVISTPWRELQPCSPFYLFVPQDTDLQAEYERAWKITDIMPMSGVGLTTARDHVVTDFEEIPIIGRVKIFQNPNDSDKEICDKLGIPIKKGWNIPNARKNLQAEKDIRKYVRPILYRMFDERLIFYHDSLIWRTVKQIMNQMLMGKNIGFCTSRNVEIGRWEHVFCTRLIVLNHSISLKEGNYLFPLYLYQDVVGQTNRATNINPAFIEDLSGKVGLSFVPDGRGNLETTVGPEDVFSYAYAVFHSPTYRQRYFKFLKGDFPRLPLTGNKALFAALVGLGAELVSLHLMESPRLENLITRFPVPGSQVVEKVRYQDSARRVYINAEQYFEGVPLEVWAFTIGGYQVCHKWLKDRKGRTLTFEDLLHYQKIIVALSETIRVMGEIDAAIDAHGGWPMD